MVRADGPSRRGRDGQGKKNRGLRRGRTSTACFYSNFNFNFNFNFNCNCNCNCYCNCYCYCNVNFQLLLLLRPLLSPKKPASNHDAA